MSVADKTVLARRPFLSGLVGVIALAGIAALEAPRLFPNLFAKRYPPTPFDDLLALLPDRENAVRLGAVLRGIGRLPVSARRLAAELRSKVGGRPLALVISGDLAENRFIEAQGWLLPSTLAELCWLAEMAETS
jgi:hypothetical protein